MTGPNSAPQNPEPEVLLIDEYWNDDTAWLGATDLLGGGSRKLHSEELITDLSSEVLAPEIAQQMPEVVIKIDDDPFLIGF